MASAIETAARHGAADAGPAARRRFALRTIALYALVALLWVGANYAALAGIDFYESFRLGRKHGILPAVVRRYEFRTIDLPLEHSAWPATLWYRYRPPPRGSGTRSVPLVVFLHGAGQRGNDNVQQLRSLPSLLCESALCKRYACAVVVPQCPTEMHWSSRLDGETDLLDGVTNMIDEVLADRRIDPERVYLTGISMGGFGSWELALRRPERFAAVAPVCGGGDETRAARLVGVPLWAVHGEADEVVPVSQSRTMIAAIREAGGDPRYLELAGVGHNCWGTAFNGEDSEVLKWMFEQSRTGHPGDVPAPASLR